MKPKNQFINRSILVFDYFKLNLVWINNFRLFPEAYIVNDEINDHFVFLEL